LLVLWNGWNIIPGRRVYAIKFTDSVTSSTQMKNALRYLMRPAISICLLFLASFLTQAQSGAGRLLGDKQEIEVPFEYRNGFMVVQLVLQKLLPMRFIIDTGAENTILLKRHYAEALRLPYHKTIRLLGSDMSREVNAFVSNGAYIQLINAPAVRHNIIILEDEYLTLEEYIGSRVDGILGAEFFRDMVLKIDYRRQIIILSGKDRYSQKQLSKYHSFDLEIIGRKPYILCDAEVNPGETTVLRMLIDTGAGLSVLFHQNTDSLLQYHGEIVKGSLGKGLGGDIEGFSGKIHRFAIGDFVFRNMISSFQVLDETTLKQDQVVRNGLIGNLLLFRFEIILDLADRKLYLKARKKYNEAFKFDKSGLTLFAFGPQLNKYYVRHIVEGSPAYAAGFKEGDIIHRVGWWPARMLSLQQINHTLSGKIGKEISFIITRNGEELRKTIRLRDLFAGTHSK
jgi:predicted aspartyl protease